MANFQIPFSVQLVNPLPVDYYYGPWSSTTQALTVVTAPIRYTGQTVCVVANGIPQEYWFINLTDAGLVPKTSSNSNSGDTFVTGGTFSNNVLTLTNNKNSSFNVSGFTSSSASTTSVISSSYSAQTGTVTSGNTYEQAISKIDGNNLTKVSIAIVSNSALTQTNSAVTWTITNYFNNTDIHISIQESGQEVSLGSPTITPSTISYTFYSTTNITASRFRAVIMGVYVSGANLLTYFTDGFGNIYVNENGDTYIL